MNSYLRLTHMKHEPLAGLRGFLGWKMIDRWCTLRVSDQLALRTLQMLTAVIEECSMALCVGSWLWQKWVTVGYQVLLDQTCRFTIESSTKISSLVSECLLLWQVHDIRECLPFPAAVFWGGNTFYILSFHHHLFSFTHLTESLRQQTVRLGNESWSLVGLVISKSL